MHFMKNNVHAVQLWGCWFMDLQTGPTFESGAKETWGPGVWGAV